MSSTPFADDLYQPQDDGGQTGEAFPDLGQPLDGPTEDQMLDAGYSPPEHPRMLGRFGTTIAEERRGETLEQRLAQEVPDVSADDDGDGLGDTVGTDGELLDDQVGSRRAGRLMYTDDGDDVLARDCGIDGGAASAEEAAMHIVDESDLLDNP